MAIVQHHTFNGPIPPPDHLSGYELVSPGAAKIILDMAVNEANHRHMIEQLTATAEISSLESADKDSRIGLWLAFIVAMTVIGGSIACILNGQQVGGSILGGVAVTGLVTAFITAGRQRKQK